MSGSQEDKVQILQEVDITIRLTISVISASSDLARFFDRVYIEPSTTRTMSVPLILIVGGSSGVDQRL